MDPRTQRSLTAIHRHLAENGRVKGKSMTTTTQLANDKKVRKDRERAGDRGRGMATATAVAAESRLPTLMGERRSSSRTEHSVDCGHGLYGGAERTTRAGWDEGGGELRGVASLSSSRRNDDGQQVHKGAQLGGRSFLTPSKPAAAAPLQSDQGGNNGVLSGVKLRSVSRSNNRRGGGSPRGGANPESASKQKLSWMEALKKKQRSLKLKQLSDCDDDHGAALTPPGDLPGGVSGGELVVLRRVPTPRKKPRITPPSTPEEENASAPWANVQLRSTPKKRESMTPTTPNIRSTGELRPVVPTSLPGIQASGSWNSVASGGSSSLAAASHSSSSSSSGRSFAVATPKASGPPLPCRAGDVVDLDAPPAEIFPEGSMSTFPLKARQGEPDRIVIVGKDAVVTAATNGRKATIAWYCRRSEIRALTLNVEATGANLAHASGRTPLTFERPEVCLEFCRAFYRGPGEDEDKGRQEGDRRASAAADGARGVGAGEGNEGTAADDASGRPLPPSGLTQDEETLLDRYRQFSHSDRTKLRLTCLSPRGEEEEVEVSLGPGSSKESAAPPGKGAGAAAIDEKAAAKFRSMLKVGIPPDAVSHKMRMEGVDAATMEAVLGNGSKAEAPSESKAGPSAPEAVAAKALSPEEEKVASKYRKMLKMGVPPDAVRHKATQEGVDAKIVDAVLAPSPPQESGSGASSQQLTSDEEKIASKYRRMLKMGIPIGGVEHKMMQEKVDPKVISAVVGGAAPPVAQKKGGKPAASSLSEDEEKVASKYRSMLKVCIPKEAVRHKMTQEGVSDKIVEAVLGKEAVDGVGKKSRVTAARPSAKAIARKTIAFHWTAANLAPELHEQSIFGRTELKKRKLSTINPEEADIKKLEELFQKKNGGGAGGARGGTAGAGARDEAGGDMAKLLDLTRANNIAISLKAFNDFTFRSLAEAIGDLDPDRKIVGERVQFLPNLLPTPKEVQAIKKFKGDDDKLVAAELFFRQLASVKRVEDKVRAMRTMSTLEENVEGARAGFRALQATCAKVMDSEKLMQVLSMVLSVGNFMNEGKVDGGVDAFKFESLPRLSQTKSADGKTTVLDYIVETFIEKGERRALSLMSEFPEIQKSSRLLIGDLVGDMNTLRNDYKLCQKELASMKKDQSSKRVTRSMSKKIKDGSEATDPRKALFAAIQSRGGSKKEDDSPKQTNDPRQALFAAIKKGGNSDDGSPSSPSEVKYSPGIDRLQTFLNHSKTVLSLVAQDQDAAIRACKGLAVYCGEEGGERAAAPLLQVLSDFALSIENGVKKYDNRVAMEKKRAAKKKKESKKEKGKENNSKNAAPPPLTKMLKASSFQPHVGRIKRANACPVKNDSRNALLNAIKRKASKKSNGLPSPIAKNCGDGVAMRTKSASGSQKEKDVSRNSSQRGNRSSPVTKMSDPKQDLLAAIKNRGDSVTVRAKKTNRSDSGDSSSRNALLNAIRQKGSPKGKDSLSCSTPKESDPKQALLTSIKNRRESLPSKSSPGVQDQVNHINHTVVRKESRVLLVNRMLSEAPASVKQDFLRGVTYKETEDPLLKKIYEKEDVKEDENECDKNWKPVVPRNELLAAIRKKGKI